MKIKTYIQASQLNSAGEMTVYIEVVTDDNKRFLVNSGLTTPEKFYGREFPKSVTNWRAKSTLLNRKLLEVEDFCLRNAKMPAAQLKQEVAAILGTKPKQPKRMLADYISDFGKTKRAYNTRRMYENTAKHVREFDAKATFETADVNWLRSVLY